MTSSEAKPKRKPFVWLAAFIVLLFGGYSVLWFVLADRLQAATERAIASLNRDDVVAECVDPKVNGFPFRLGVSCESLSFEDPARGIAATAGGLRTAAQVYAPSQSIAELDGPLRVSAPRLPPLWLDWDRLRASVRLAQPLPERLSVEAEGLSAATDPEEEEAIQLFSAEKAESHWRPNGADVDWAASVTGLQLDAAAVGGHSLPSLSGSLDMTLTDGVAAIARRDQSLRGRAGTVRSLELSLGPTTGLTLSGPFSVDENGLLDARLNIVLRDPQGLAGQASAAFPEAQDQIAAAASGLAALGASGLPVRIDKGRAMLGFIPLGKVPPLP
jgi:hypothetical protein